MPLPLKRFMERLNRDQNRQDPYRSKLKPAGMPQCPSCGAVNVRGDWVPAETALKKLRSADVVKKGRKPRKKPEMTVLPVKEKRFAKVKCPACRQLEENYAGGVIELHGDWQKVSEQLFNTIENTEEIARLRNDQHRVLWSRSYRGVTKVYVTMPELARHIGRQLEKSFKSRIEYVHSTEEPFLRVVFHYGEKLSRRQKGAKDGTKTTPARSRTWRGRGAAR